MKKIFLAIPFILSLSISARQTSNFISKELNIKTENIEYPEKQIKASLLSSGKIYSDRTLMFVILEPTIISRVVTKRTNYLWNCKRRKQ